jgi:hypothetical protein
MYAIGRRKRGVRGGKQGHGEKKGCFGGGACGNVGGGEVRKIFLHLSCSQKSVENYFEFPN